MMIPVNQSNLSEASQRSWSLPEYYEDEYYECVECGTESLFTAEMQQQWYEVKKKYFYQRPIRCLEHYVEWKKEKDCKIKMDQCLAALRADPESGNLQYVYACAVIAFHKQTGEGNLQVAIQIFKKLQSCEDELRYCRSHLWSSDACENEVN